MSKIIFVEAKRKYGSERLKEQLNSEIKKIQYNRIGIIASIQYINIVSEIKKILESNKREVFTAKGRIGKYVGQILGCDVSAATKIEYKIDAFLFIGTGQFHLLNLALKTKKPIFILNPETFQISKLDKEEIRHFQNKIEASKKKFLVSTTVGIIVSTKPGQNNIGMALELKKKLEKMKKKVFLFICDFLDKNELENFKCDIWINTACPGIALDDARIVNMEEILQYF